MDNFHCADIVYFSGTGCTAKVASALEKEFLKNNITANKYQLKGQFQAESKSDLLIILFPVYAANAPLPVDEWIAAAAFGSGKKTAVISVSGGGEMVFNTACRLSTINSLIKKGYDVFYEEMFVMPTNCLTSNSDALNAMLFNVLPQKADNAVRKILSGAIHRKKPYIIDRIISKSMIIEKRMSKSFGKKLSISNNCTGCGMCAQNCPRNNIEIQNGNPVFKKNCVMCLKCIYSCPEKAIILKTLKSFILKDGFDIDVIEEKSKNIISYPPAKEAAKGFLYKGVREYLEKEGY